MNKYKSSSIINTMNEHKLNSKWVLWYHNPNDSSWDMTSYHKVMELFSVENFWDMFTILKTTHFQNGMFFLMKDKVKPMWEDIHNVDGGCWSFRVNKKDVPKTWQELVLSAVGECLINNKYSKTINGISISPKRSFSIIKIWNDNIKINEGHLLNQVSGLNMDELIYKPHVESIDKDKEKRLNRQKAEMLKEQENKDNNIDNNTDNNKDNNIDNIDNKDNKDNKDNNKDDNKDNNKDDNKDNSKNTIKKRIDDDDSDDEESLKIYQLHQAKIKSMLE